MSIKTAAELWRNSLNSTTIILRSSQKFNGKVESYSFWAETYYQISLAFFPSEIALTPYKLKLLLYAELVASGFFETHWNHMTEGLERFAKQNNGRRRINI